MTNREKIAARLRELVAEMHTLRREYAHARPCSPHQVRTGDRLWDVRAMIAKLDRKLDELDARAA